MSRQGRNLWALLLAILTPLSGCAPSRSFYFFEDGDLSHYRGVATEIEYPDVESNHLAEVTQALAPPSLRNYEDFQPWPMTLQEAVKTALANSKVVRTGAPDALLRNPDGAPTIYEPALAQANPGVGGRIGGGVESALSAFDAQLSSSMFWERNEEPRNVGPGAGGAIFARDFLQDTATFQAQISKIAATGTQFFVRNNTIYDGNNNPTRDVFSDYQTNIEAEMRHPLLQGGGTLFNRIAGPGLGPGNFNGVIIARINSDIALTDFEGQVLNQMSDVEQAYWNLYRTFRIFDIERTGFDESLRQWKQAIARDFPALEEARARAEYFAFKARMEEAWRQLHIAESRLRYLLGLAATDGRLIRPIDEPTVAHVYFDWCEVNSEALARQVNLRRHKWRIKQREMELIASKNFLLPRLDAVARYRWLGLGDDLIDSDGFGVIQPNTTATSLAGTDAFSTLTDGNYQSWQMGLQFSMPIGFRRELAGVRFAELQLARDRAVLQDMELEVTHLLSEAIRDVDANYVITETHFNRRVAAQEEVRAAEKRLELSRSEDEVRISLDQLLNALRRQADAEREYYNSLVNYNISILSVHFRKGSLLEYNNVYLAEGPWPCKAYYDAHQRARERDAGLFINYGYTRPAVISRGPIDQHAGQHTPGLGYGEPTPAGAMPEEVSPPRETEEIPPPMQPEAEEMPPMTSPQVTEPAPPANEGPRLSASSISFKQE